MCLPPSSHLQKRFKSPNPATNLHRRNKADATSQIVCDIPAANGGETSAHIFVGTNSKVTDPYKEKNNSGDVFIACLQERALTRGFPTKLVADNVKMYQSWRVIKYIRDLTVNELTEISGKLRPKKRFPVKPSRTRFYESVAPVLSEYT